MTKSHQDTALDLLFKNFTTNIQNHLAWRAKWSKGSLQSKRMIQKLLFPQNISYEKGVGFGTPKISFPFFVFGEQNDQSDTMVELRGIEPLTSTLPA